MKCNQIEELMGAYLYGDLSPELMREIRMHANECEACREDLRSRTAVVASIPDRVPELTDVERQRIAWYVEGAVGRNVQSTPARFKLATVFGGVVVIGAAIAIGALLASNMAKPTDRQTAQSDPKPAMHATVKIQEEPIKPAAKVNSETAINRPAGKANDADTDQITQVIADAMQSVFRGGAGLAVGRGNEAPRSRAVPSEEVIEEVTTPAGSPTDETQSSPTKLPKPFDLNDARISPAHSGE